MKDKAGLLKQCFSQLGYELGLRSSYYTNTKIVGPTATALVLDLYFKVAPVQLHGQQVNAAIDGKLPERAWRGKKFGVEVLGMPIPGILFEAQTGVRPSVHLEVLRR